MNDKPNGVALRIATAEEDKQAMAAFENMLGKGLSQGLSVNETMNLLLKKKIAGKKA